MVDHASKFGVAVPVRFKSSEPIRSNATVLEQRVLPSLLPPHAFRSGGTFRWLPVRQTLARVSRYRRVGHVASDPGESWACEPVSSAEGAEGHSSVDPEVKRFTPVTVVAAVAETSPGGLAAA